MGPVPNGAIEQQATIPRFYWNFLWLHPGSVSYRINVKPVKSVVRFLSYNWLIGQVRGAYCLNGTITQKIPLWCQGTSNSLLSAQLKQDWKSWLTFVVHLETWLHREEPVVAVGLHFCSLQYSHYTCYRSIEAVAVPVEWPLFEGEALNSRSRVLTAWWKRQHVQVYECPHTWHELAQVDCKNLSLSPLHSLESWVWTMTQRLIRETLFKTNFG